MFPIHPDTLAALQAGGLLTIDQVARFLSVSKRTVLRLVAAGKLPRPITVSRKIKRWRPADLMTLMQQPAEQPAEQPTR